ncbi:MAG TPA: DUF2231 domain-containing protein [Thermoanaerobaculia bacterium]|nr:DUF2231 domain-containing protein [Thermoanaerobaculia bacterium]
MRSRAALGGHPLHPAMVAIPIGAFTVTLVADLLVLVHRPGPWDATARYSLALGIAGALAAAVLGFIDYFGVEMSPAGKKVVVWHLRVNLAAVALFGASLWLRQSDPARWCMPGFAASTTGYVLLMVGGWLGGKLVFEHKVGVIETADPQATEIGQRQKG